MKLPISKTAITVLLATCVFLISNAMGYKILISNTSSLPYNVFIQTPKQDFKMGDIVTFKYQKEDYFKYKTGDNFTKKIGCMPNQKLERIEDNFYCNNLFLGTVLKIDSNGKEIKSQYFNEIVPNEKFFMIGTNHKSYDSRYFGYVDKKDIVGVTYAIF